MRKTLFVGTMIFSLCTILAPQTRGAAPHGDVSLMGTLTEWMYPGSHFDGAKMSDGGNRQTQAVYCQAIMTTNDSVEKVAKFYNDKSAAGSRDAKTKEKAVAANSVSTQDASGGRPVQLRVVVVNTAETSTTLVISRAEGEKKTQVAWTHYVRLGSGSR